MLGREMVIVLTVAGWTAETLLMVELPDLDGAVAFQQLVDHAAGQDMVVCASVSLLSIGAGSLDDPVKG